MSEKKAALGIGRTVVSTQHTQHTQRNRSLDHQSNVNHAKRSRDAIGMVRWLSEGENTLKAGSSIQDGDAKEEVLGH